MITHHHIKFYTIYTILPIGTIYHIIRMDSRTARHLCSCCSSRHSRCRRSTKSIPLFHHLLLHYFDHSPRYIVVAVVVEQQLKPNWTFVDCQHVVENMWNRSHPPTNIASKRES